ncbi:hypothetical protein VCRA2119O149_11220001 [Vibrio crassostreae]|nr:hypothetical protein VCRA2119O149_11220001 [Vibrio crassostreae]
MINLSSYRLLSESILDHEFNGIGIIPIPLINLPIESNL